MSWFKTAAAAKCPPISSRRSDGAARRSSMILKARSFAAVDFGFNATLAAIPHFGLVSIETRVSNETELFPEPRCPSEALQC
jgi:hypothetical protein